MKKLCTALILCLVSIMARGQYFREIGSYMSCKLEHSIVASNPEISADFLTFIYAENGTFLALNGSELERLKQTLILVKEKYKELKESAIENNASNAVSDFPYTFPTLRIGWYSEKYSKIVSSEPINLTPSFLIHDGEYIMFIMKDVISENNETEKFIWKLCSETDFDTLIYYLDADLIKQSFKK